MTSKFKVEDKVRLNREITNKGCVFKKDTLGEVVGVKNFMCYVKMQDDITKQDVVWYCYEDNLEYVQATDFDLFAEDLEKLLHKHHAEIFIGDKDIDEQSLLISINSNRERRFAVNDLLSHCKAIDLKRLPRYMK